MRERDDCPIDGQDCSTCGDVAVALRVLRHRDGVALVADEHGAESEVAVDFIPDVRDGDVLLVHGGVAIGRAGPAAVGWAAG